MANVKPGALMADAQRDQIEELLVLARHLEIAHHVPGRTRVKVSPKHRTAEEMEWLAKTLKDRLGSADARMNVKTGSIVVSHPQSSLEEVCTALEDVGVLVIGLTGSHLAFEGGRTRVASHITGAVADLNQRLERATNDLINLRLAVPFGLAGLALRQQLRYGWQFEAAPWYVLAYAAFDSFVKLHYSREMEQVGPCSQDDAGSVH